MKKSFFLLGVFSSLVAMHEDTQVSRFDQHRAELVAQGLADLFRKEEQPHINPLEIAPDGPAENSAPSIEDVKKSREDLIQALHELEQLQKIIGPKEFEIIFQRACEDVRAMQALQTLDDPDKIEQTLAFFRLPVRTATAALSATAIPVAATKILRGQVRLPMSIISSLFSPNFFYIGFALIFYIFYEARDWYKDIKLWWRGRKIDRLEQALSAVEVLGREQRALQTHVDTLERAKNHTEEELKQLAQTAKTLCEYIDGIACATGQSLEQLRPEVAGIAHDVGALKEINQKIQAKLALSTTLIEEMRAIVQRLAAGHKKK